MWTLVGLGVQNEFTLLLVKNTFPSCTLDCGLGGIDTPPPTRLCYPRGAHFCRWSTVRGKEGSTGGWRKLYSDPGSLMTSLESLNQALPETKGITASLSQYPLVKPHGRIPIILASVVCPALRWVAIKVHCQALHTSPPLKTLQILGGGHPNHTIRLVSSNSLGREKESWINTTATTSHYIYKGARHGKVCMPSGFCANVMETTSVSSLRKKKERQLENQKQHNLFQWPYMKQTLVRHVFEQLVEHKKRESAWP